MIKIIFLITALLICNLSEAQRLIQLPPELGNATPMQVRWKSGIGFQRYVFGSYQLINGKDNWVNTSTEIEGGFLHDMLSTMRDVNQFVRTRRSFQLVNNQGDTGTVNMAITTVMQFEQYKKGLLGNQYESQRFEGSYTTWIAAIETPDTTQHWLLTAFQQENPAILSNANDGISFTKTSPLEASLKNDDRQLEVLPVRHYSDGKKGWDVLGFIIVEGGVPLAAMQFRGPNPLKHHLQSYIWLSPANDSYMQLILATTLTALLSVGHDVYYSTMQD
jgi:hypothetical protein